MRLTNLSCTSTVNQWLSNHKDVQPMKVKDMNFGREDFCQQGKKKRPFVSKPKKIYSPLIEKGDMKMLRLNDFAESLTDVCPESILFSAVPKPDVDFVADFVEVPENLCSVYEWISNSANVEGFFTNLFVDIPKEKISKIELMTRGQNNNKLCITRGKELL